MTVFYAALYTIALGTEGTKPNISTTGTDQFDEFQPLEKTQKLTFFNWWMFSIFFSTLFSNTFLIYIQDNVGFSLGYGLPTVGLVVVVAVFVVGTPFYRHRVALGSLFVVMARAVLAALRKRNAVFSDDVKELYELGFDDYSKLKKFRIDHTNSFRFLDKAAVKTTSTSSWTLCSMTQVEETKQMIKMLPVLMVSFIPSAVIAQVGTLFVKQGTTLDRNMGPHFEIPPACLSAFVAIFMLISLFIYDRYFVPLARSYTNNPRGITLLQRFGIGLVLHVIVMITACLAERKRLNVAREYNLLCKGDQLPPLIFILLPQFALVGIADAFLEVARLDFFYDQAPDGMKSLGTSYCSSSLGIGHFLSSFLLTTVFEITAKNGRTGWISDNLQIFHLDYYYAFLAALSLLNLLAFLVVAKFFVHNVEADCTGELQKITMEASRNKDEDVT